MGSGERPPVIGFLTDFGLDGAAAVCRGVMLSICPSAQIVDVSHSIRKYAVRDGAFVLRATLPYLPVGVHVGVVDPGVGTPRRPIAVRVARGDVLVGPDNGLLLPAADALGGAVDARELTNRDLWLPDVSATFHGRDLFAPVAAHLSAGDAAFDDVGPPIGIASLVRLPAPRPRATDGRVETEVTYVDSFGNLRMAGRLDDLAAAFGRLDRLHVRARVGTVDFEEVAFVPSFGHVAEGALVLYVDSTGDLALAVSRGDLAARTGATTGTPVSIGRR
jgi:S-adenosyl-L-methionine hydrolase (adenosine-forming)